MFVLIVEKKPSKSQRLNDFSVRGGGQGYAVRKMRAEISAKSQSKY